MKRVRYEVLPIILKIIQQNNQSRRPLKLSLSKPVIMQKGMELMLIAVKLLSRLSCLTLLTFNYVDVLGCRLEQSGSQRMRVPFNGKVGETAATGHKYTISDAGQNNIGYAGCKHLLKANWPHLKSIDLGTSCYIHRSQ